MPVDTATLLIENVEQEEEGNDAAAQRTALVSRLQLTCRHIDYTDACRFCTENGVALSTVLEGIVGSGANRLAYGRQDPGPAPLKFVHFGSRNCGDIAAYLFLPPHRNVIHNAPTAFSAADQILHRTSINIPNFMFPQEALRIFRALASFHQTPGQSKVEGLG